ncbi:MAG: SCO family protein [Verrucomicrobiota bacterium]
MKTATLLLAFALAAAPPAPSAAALEPCCELLVAGKPPTARSLYQFDAIWTNDAGRPVRLAMLRDRPVVVAMFFAQCEYACPLLVADLQRLRQSLSTEVRAKTQFVLVSFDSARDTPAALRAYRERMSLDAGWTLLRGDSAAVQDLAMLLGVKFKQDARGQFAHSNLITVLNAEGEIAHQLAGLQGDVSNAAKAVALAAK